MRGAACRALIKKKNAVPVTETAFFLEFDSIVVHYKSAARKERRDDEPNRRKCNQRIHDDRAHTAGASEHERNEVESEEPEKTPVQSADDHENISDNVCYLHCLFPPISSMRRFYKDIRK